MDKLNIEKQHFNTSAYNWLMTEAPIRMFGLIIFILRRKLEKLQTASRVRWTLWNVLITYNECDRKLSARLSTMLSKMASKERPPRGSNQHSKLLFYNKNQHNILRSRHWKFSNSCATNYYNILEAPFIDIQTLECMTSAWRQNYLNFIFASKSVRFFKLIFGQ